VDADYSTRLIGDSNDDSEIFMAIYRRPSAGFPRFSICASLPPKITTTRTATLKIIRAN